MGFTEVTPPTTSTSPPDSTEFGATGSGQEQLLLQIFHLERRRQSLKLILDQKRFECEVLITANTQNHHFWAVACR